MEGVRGEGHGYTCTTSATAYVYYEYNYTIQLYNKRNPDGVIGIFH
jgi:hypothetical protein